MDRRRLLQRLLSGSLQNVSFRDLQDLVGAFGFRLVRINGSHHIFAHPAIGAMLNLQGVRGAAKPYQIRQLLRLVERYDLKLDGGEPEK